MASMLRAWSALAPRRLARSLATDAFGALEHQMWQAGATAYSNTFAQITGQASNTLLDAAGVHTTPAAATTIVEKVPLALDGSEKRVLDVACGPGQV
eukprot:3567968-Prymnesium_polylepis.1